MLFYSNAVLAQNQLSGKTSKTWNFEHIGIQEGLSQGSVLSLLQDHHGFVWIGTRDGLNRYDGINFTIFRHRVNDATTISGNIINDIKEDASGNIWVVTENGVSKLDKDSGIFYNYELDRRDYENGTFNVLWVDENQKVWAGNNYGLFYIEDNKLTQHSNLDIRHITAITSDESGKLWIGTSNFKIFQVDVQNHHAGELEINGPGKTYHARVESILVEPNGSFWIGSYGEGLFYFNAKGNLVQQYGASEPQLQKRLTNNNIRALAKDKKNRLWVGTFDGLQLIDNFDIVQTAIYQKNNPKGLTHSSIRALMVDKKGSVWIGAYIGGINLFDEEYDKFNHQNHIPNDPNSLSYSVVGSFIEDKKGNIIIGTERGGINMFDYQSEKHVPIGDQRLTVKSLLLDSHNQLWAGVFRKGLNLVNLQTKTLERFPKADDVNFGFLHTAIINCMIEDPSGGIWINTDSGGGLHFFDTEKRKFLSFPGQEAIHQIIKNVPVKSMFLSKNGTLVLATKGNGVILFDPKTEEIKQFKQFEVGNDTLFIDEFNHVMEDSKGDFYLSTNGSGILILNPLTHKAKHIHSGDGLSNNIVYGAMEDHHKNVWILTISGITKIKASGIFKNYTIASGFPLEEMNEGAFMIAKNGDFVIGGNNGYVRFDPIALKDNEYIPPVRFTDLLVLNKKVLPGDDTNILSRNLHESTSITLSYYQNILTFEFAALNYIRSETNQYAYMLEGFDEDWVYGNNRNHVTYTSLPRGNYLFKVKASNNDGIWNEVPLEMSVVVLPPPWRTWWAMGIYGMLVILGFFVIRYNAVKSTQLKHVLKIEQLEKTKLKDDHDLKLRYFIDVSHEFRTPLTLIIAPLEDLLRKIKGEENKWLKRPLKILHFNAKRLQHLIDQILEIREIETGHHQLNLQPVFLASLLQDIIDSFNMLADQKKIKLSLYLHHVPETVLLLDPDKVQKILFNLLSNAFKFTDQGGEIAVSVKIINEKYKITVRDTGKGIQTEDLHKIFDRFYKKGKDNHSAGIGLSLTQLLVAIHGGSIYVESEPDKGTVFTMVFPFDTADGENLEIQETKFTKPVPLEYYDVITEKSKNDKETLDSGTKILVVDDNQELRLYLKEQLGEFYKVVTAKNGESGLNKAKKIGPALIISDVMMPKMDGYEFCHAIKSTKELSHIPIILLTAKNSQMNKMEGLELGADDYISKPFQILELMARIQNLIQNRKLLHDKYKNLGISTEYLINGSNSYDEKLLNRLYTILQDNLDQPNLTVEAIGDQLGLSRVHLFRKIKALTGMSPSDLIKDYRIKQACIRLETGNFKIAEVATEVGFQDVQYFSKVFKKEKGLSPSDYMKSSMTLTVKQGELIDPA
ncbi:hypothetical protein EL17_00495 [Anditalea andensis]|uniref:histidine kinase n=1 Tax=Anditalea andensis TaxID=1048983 RepID=A0A074L073_9BACT|nr:hypothetical protein EL17_00495 [Anditalea andensis]